MAGHAATSLTNIAQVQVADHNHLSTKDLPDQYGFGDEHYNFQRNVRGSHHVLATLDERTYTPGRQRAWARTTRSRGASSTTATTSTTTPGTPKSYRDGRTWVTSMGHFGASYTRERRQQQPGQADRRRRPLGRGRGQEVRLLGHGLVLASRRTVLVADANNPIGIDVAKDGKVYWSEIGSPHRRHQYNSEGYDQDARPRRAAGNKTTVATIPTRADHGNSEDGVLGMSLQPDFDLADPTSATLRLLLAAQRAGTGRRGHARAGRRLQPDQPLDAERRRHRGRAGLRARDPARPQGQDRRLARPASRRPDRLRPRPRRRRRPGLRLRRQPVPRRR